MSNPYLGPWRNTAPCFRAAMYIQFCKLPELEAWDKKLYGLIMRYGSFFDDTWEYWVTKDLTYIRRTPLGYGKRVPTEHHRKYEPNRKLGEFQMSVKKSG